MQNHRRMVYHQLQTQHISLEDQEKVLSEWFVRAPDAEEQAAMDRTCVFFGKDPGSGPRHTYHISSGVNDDYIRFAIRRGLRSGRISRQDLRQFITERMVPFEESGLRFSLALIHIKYYLFLERRIPFLFTILGPGGTDPGPRGTRIVAQVTTDGLVDFTELNNKSVEGAIEAEVAEQKTILHTYLQQVLKSCDTNYSPYQAQKEVDQSPDEKPDDGDDDRSPVSGEPPEENGDEGDGHISPMSGEPSEMVDEDDGHGSDDLDDQNTAPTSCGSETDESDYDEYGRMALALCKATVEQSHHVKQLQRTLLKISQCDKMADLKSLEKQMRETEDQMD
ncbi:hypothetical protein H9Q69_010695 [Fusarium xylarioides]|uniref:Uncharacterized protein n=1 Tax=Fusarium xylarioides TaxID=221167 RepID=A0A9P7HRQ4_9HYPO|nr:hypothetical protein H9Q72_009465 [Fusarium xylarioides]KAG5790236.1 hypothetical protein H9Q69_010695 [Fusarium xylarioides]KAG5806853.1 hypothetical protein H9Q71_008578 [Fusarium xylarioides]KAG5820771.1 hypothetical protein H9Q74_008686 [Fusarium xylarioides]